MIGPNSYRVLAFPHSLMLFEQDLTALGWSKQWMAVKPWVLDTVLTCCAPLGVYLFTWNLKTNSIYWDDLWGSSRGIGSKNSAGDRARGFAAALLRGVGIGEGFHKCTFSQQMLSRVGEMCCTDSYYSWKEFKPRCVATAGEAPSCSTFGHGQVL